MRLAKTLLPLLSVVVTLAGASGMHFSFNDQDPPKIIAVTSLQRSGSTTVSRLIASQKCVVWGNEIWKAGDSQQDVLEAHGLTGHDKAYSSAHPVEFMLAVNKAVCESDLVPEECHGRCSIVVKLFDIHGVKDDALKNFLVSPDVGIVMLEREISEWYSSNMSAQLNGDWTTTPSASRPDHELFSIIPREVQQRHDGWYSSLRSTLREADKFYIEVPFAAVKTCSLFNRVLPSIFKFFGFDTAESVEIEDMFEDDTLEAIAENCQDFQAYLFSITLGKCLQTYLAFSCTLFPRFNRRQTVSSGCR